MQSVVLAVLLCGVAAAIPTSGNTNTPKHFIFVLQDDLGHYDVAFNGNTTSELYSGNLSSLAAEGIVLERHYVHWHCSPTRRSLLTGRLPVHHGELLSQVQTDDIDLRWSWISDKLKKANYSTHWYGKGHTGYKSFNHLPINHGFDHHTGFLTGAQDYFSDDRWEGDQPLRNDTEYSTQLYGHRAVDALQRHDPSTPLFMFLPFQAVHSPYEAPKHASGGSVLQEMLRASDHMVGKLVVQLKEKKMWDDTLIIFSADNGGVSEGNNFPLRGEKHTNWEGGMRAAAFVSGGLVPTALRGTRNKDTLHIVDWYPTLCNLAGVDPHDNPPIPPLPIDPSDPTKDIYGKKSYPAVDGVDIWPLLTKSANPSRTSLVLSNEVYIQGDLKLIVSQPNPDWMSANYVNNGWKTKGQVWTCANGQPAEMPECAGDEVEYGCNEYTDRTDFQPCLFNVTADVEERHNLAKQQPALVTELWKQLNLTMLTKFHSRSPSSLLGPCESRCAQHVWAKFDPPGEKKTPDGPICGVPQCK